MNEVFLGAVDLSLYYRARIATTFYFYGLSKPLLKDLELLTTNSLKVGFSSPSLDFFGLLKWTLAQPSDRRGNFFVTMYDLQGNYVTLWFSR